MLDEDALQLPIGVHPVLESLHRQRSICSDFMGAMLKNEWKTAVELLKNNRWSRDTVARQTTPLLLAINLGRLDFVELLVTHGASLNQICDGLNEKPAFPLHRACVSGMEDVARFLVQAGADVNKREDNETALCRAIQAAKPEIVDLLLANGAAIDVQMKKNECPLYNAAMLAMGQNSKSVLRIILILLQHGVSPDTCDGTPLQLTPLYFSVENKVPAISMLMECGAVLGPKTLSNLNPLLNDRLKTDSTYYEWLKEQLSVPYSLKCLSARAIRMHLLKTHKRSILEHLLTLKLPKSLIQYLTLHEYDKLTAMV